MDFMKRLVFLLGSSWALLAAADLSAVRNVYVMPMARGLDQYLASQLAARGVFQVVTDPKLADAVLTDHVGNDFQSQLEAIFPTPKPEADEKEEEAPEAAAKADTKSDTKSDAKSARSKKDQQEDSQSPLAAFSGAANKPDNVVPVSQFGRSKGNIFLVAAKSRQVIWSTYDPPKTTQAKDLHRTATDIVSRISKELKKQ